MNQYTKILEYIKTLGDADSFVNTVTRNGSIDLDINKANVFPILDIYVDSGSFTNGQTILFNIQLVCVSKRNINKKINTDKFWENDNEVDNHNETLATLNRIWTTMYRDFSENNITSSENPTLEKIAYENKNILDGWRLTFDVEVPNVTLNLC